MKEQINSDIENLNNLIATRNDCIQSNSSKVTITIMNNNIIKLSLSIIGSLVTNANELTRENKLLKDELINEKIKVKKSR